MTLVPFTQRKKSKTKLNFKAAQNIYEGGGGENTRNAAGLPRLALPDDVGG